MVQKLRTIYYFIRIVPRLGVWNMAYMIWYRFSLKSGLRRFLFPAESLNSTGVFFDKNVNVVKPLSFSDKLLETADRILAGELRYYGYHWIKVGNPPNWFRDPFSGNDFSNTNKHWTLLPDFSGVGDIKNIWEVSRLSWVPTLAAAYSCSGNEKYIDGLNSWLDDWSDKNPANTGPNWKCGQEASIRIINIVIALTVLEQVQTPSSKLLHLIDQHLSRIDKNFLYSIAQDNNHGISEAAGLYLGGAFLRKADPLRFQKAYHYFLKGKKWLENRVGRLIMSDGSFSQHSIVYHRMVLDVLSVVELIRIKWELEKFSSQYYSKISSAIYWYSAFIDPESGNAPNLGPNDGTLLFDFGIIKYRDFRPSLMLASAAFNITVEQELVSVHPLLELFDVNAIINKKSVFAGSQLFNEGGYCKLAGKDSTVFLRLPKYKFRPSNSDGLHIDLWKNGVNIIRDAGSYSYAVSSEEKRRFSGTGGHSTIQFSNNDQMPDISRFLYGNWLTPNFTEFDKSNNSASCGYTDHMGNEHNRSVYETQNGWKIKDNIITKSSSATLRFLLSPDEWELNDNTLANSDLNMSFSSDIIEGIVISNGWESLFYMEKQEIQVLEVSLAGSGTVETLIEYK